MGCPHTRIRDIGAIPVRSDGDPNWAIPHRDRGHHRVAGRVDHRNIVGDIIRDIGVFPIQGDRDVEGSIPHRDRGHYRVAGRVDH